MMLTVNLNDFKEAVEAIWLRGKYKSSTVSKVVSWVLLSSTVTTPSLPTLSIAVAIKFPISGSLLDEIVATCLICSSEEMFFDKSCNISRYLIFK